MVCYCMAACIHLKVCQLDTKTISLNGDLLEEAHVNEPIGFVMVAQEDKCPSERRKMSEMPCAYHL